MITRNLGWAFAVVLGLLPGATQAQSKPMSHTAPEVTAPAAANETEVVWLRRRVEQLEAQLATSKADCPTAMKSKMKGNKDGAMPAAKPMGKGKMGGGMDSMPMPMPMEGGHM